MDADIKFIGWIPGKPEDRRTLRQLGVIGRMTYYPGDFSDGTGYFRQCEVTTEVMERLIYEFHLTYPGAFTSICESGNGSLWLRRWDWMVIDALKVRVAELEEAASGKGKKGENIDGYI